MKMLEGILVGAILVATAVGIGWWMGWVHLALPGSSMAEMSAAEHAGMDMEPAAQDENASTVMEPTTQDEHAGMDMEPVAQEENAGMDMDPAAQDESAGMDMGAGPAADPVAAAGDAVMISPERQQLIGVRTARVVRQNLINTIRTVGRVEYDETRVAHIHTKITGWIETLHVDFTGKLVEPGQPLLEIYSPELVATQEEYLLALRGLESLGNSTFPEVASASRSLLAATRRRLELWDISDVQIVQLETRREPQKTLTLHSPIRGFVIHKNAYEGQFVGPQADLFTIADLEEVWVIADIYERDLPYVRVGQRATVSLSYMPESTYRGRVDYVYPYLEGATRTAKARIVLPNRDLVLKPDMFANVELVANVGSGLVIPEDAIIDTGARQVAFLVLEGGHFQPVNVRIGGRFDGQLQVLSGLEEGQTVVSGAAFLVDSESKLRSAMGGMDMSQHQD